VDSVTPDDEIHLTNFGKTFWIKNETYQFELVYEYSVPRTINRHIVYTSSSAALKQTFKRSIMDNLPHLMEVSEEDHILLTSYLEDMPSEIRVNKKKRSLPLIDGSLRVIQLAPKVKVLMAYSILNSRKRSVSEFGSAVCLHIPFFTTCDNSADLDKVRDALNASVSEIYSEIDSYKKTDNARAQTLSAVLNTQRKLIDTFATTSTNTAKAVANVAQSVQINAAQIADGDFQAHSQINYLKRVTNTLLKYSNAMASTDPRAVVAQPALTQLFFWLSYCNS